MLPDVPDYQPVYQPVPPVTRRGPSIGTAVAVIAVAAILLGVAISFIDMNLSSRDYSDKSVTCEWSVIEGLNRYSYSITFELPGEEMKAADASSIDREGTSTNVSDHASGIYAVKEFVVISDTIRALSDQLWEEYEKSGITKNAKTFADYILRFVQSVASYEYDSDEFGQDEYWQYPIETLYRGYGDCEDTSILAAAIYGALMDIDGAKDYILGTSVLLLPGHAMVGVRINGTLSDEYYSIKVDGQTHYLGETTVDSEPGHFPENYYYIGYINASYAGSSILAFTGHTNVYV